MLCHVMTDTVLISQVMTTVASPTRQLEQEFDVDGA